MYFSVKCVFGIDVECLRNLMRKFFGVVCSDVNMIGSKDKRENLISCIYKNKEVLVRI